MILAITNSFSAPLVTSDSSAINIDNVLFYTSDEKYISDGTSAIFEVAATAGAYTYVGISGHNLGDIGATISIINHGVIDIIDYNCIDNRVLMFKVPPRSGGIDLVIKISKPASSKVIINHIAAGQHTDLTGTSDSGQSVSSDYEAGYARIPMNISRKVKSTTNQGGAPTAALMTVAPQKLRLSLKNIPSKFAREELQVYLKWWVTTGFFMQNDNNPGQSYLASEFTSSAPMAHAQTRQLVTVSYSFMGYTGQ